VTDPVLYPVALLRPYDNLDAVGDDGWSVDRIVADARTHGILKPLEVAQSAAQLDAGDDAIYVFNGQHRLAAAQALGLTHVPVVPATRSEDAVYAEAVFG
jgi:ParB-like chromosome segregation protein Spo0J